MSENLYQTLKENQQKKLNSFPIGFAYSDEQFKDQMKKLGLNETDTNKIVSIGSGGFIRKEDVNDFIKLTNSFDEEIKNAIASDKTGTGFIKDMFLYELGNHEYIITHDLTDTLEALDIKPNDIKNDIRLWKGLALAKQEYFNEFKKKDEKNIKREER